MKPALEENLYYAMRNIREPLLKPLVAFFAFLRFQPEWLSYLGVIFMLSFIYWIRTNLWISFYFLITAVFMDVLDGSLARYLNIQSDRGKFTDVLMDNVIFTLFVIGLVHASLLSGLIATIYVYFMLLVKVLMVVKKNISRESDWLIKSMVGAFPNIFVYLSYVFFAFYLFGSANYLSLVSLFFSILLIIKAIMDYWFIRTMIFTK